MAAYSLEDHPLLAGEFARVEDRSREDVADHVERDAGILAEHARGVAGTLRAGGGIDVAADILDVLGDPAGGAGLGSLERHMLDEMAEAALIGPLVARSGAHPDSQCRGRDTRHRLRGHGDAVGEAGYFQAGRGAMGREMLVHAVSVPGRDA